VTVAEGNRRDVSIRRDLEGARSLEGHALVDLEGQDGTAGLRRKDNANERKAAEHFASSGLTKASG
jgi:hypothetical protein